MVIFKIYGATTWLTSSCNTYIAQYLTKERQTDNEIWSINRLWQKIFSYKNQAENEPGRLVPDLFAF